MAARYHFITEIELVADPRDVWDALARSEDWPGWWKWLEFVEVIDEGGRDGVGRRVRNVVASPLLYRLSYEGEVTRVGEPYRARFEAVGDLEGVGQFEIDSGGGSTVVTFDWLVTTPRWWMNLLAPIARPLFAWSHHRLMDDFGVGLAQASGGTLLDVTNHSLDPREPGFFELPPWTSPTT